MRSAADSPWRLPARHPRTPGSISNRPFYEGIILGGQVGWGDYSKSDIELANKGRDIWTAGALTFWQTHAEGRQTVVYAVSVTHAENLAAVFRGAGIPTGILLKYTSTYHRAKQIRQFKDGTLKVLVNVAVATEGFDLPDAACVVMARPTLSLALFLQMVGRGLRPKRDGGNCLILDLAGNVEIHGLPEDDRDWSLESRGRKDEPGDCPVVRCPLCSGVSPAASRSCQACGSHFGKDCARCGHWRSWKRWSAETYCGEIHDLVCNLCHIDAHELDFLPDGLKEVLRERLARIHRWTGMDGVRTAEGGEGVTGAMIRARIWVDGRLAGGLQALLGAPMAAYSGCGERDGGIGHGKRRSRTGLARVCWDVGLAGGSVADGRRQAGSGMARSRARARLNCSSQGQRRGRCRVNRRAERVIRPAKAKTRRLRVLVVTIC